MKPILLSDRDYGRLLASLPPTRDRFRDDWLDARGWTQYRLDESEEIRILKAMWNRFAGQLAIVNVDVPLEGSARSDSWRDAPSVAADSFRELEVALEDWPWDVILFTNPDRDVLLLAGTGDNWMLTGRPSSLTFVSDLTTGGDADEEALRTTWSTFAAKSFPDLPDELTDDEAFEIHEMDSYIAGLVVDKLRNGTRPDDDRPDTTLLHGVVGSLGSPADEYARGYCAWLIELVDLLWPDEHTTAAR